MKKEVCDVLNAPLQHYTREAPGGGTFSYVKGEDVIKQLNKAFDHNWSSRVIHHSESNAQVLVMVRLTVMDGNAEVSHEAFGSSPLMAYKSGPNAGKVISLGNNYKSAYTDALKKAAAQFGVGLSDDEEEEESTPASSPPASNKPVSFAPRTPTGSPQPRFAPTNRPSFGSGPKLTTSIGASANLQQVKQPEVQKEVSPGDILVTTVQGLVLQRIAAAHKTTEEELILKVIGKSTSKKKFEELTKDEATKIIKSLNIPPPA